jgi:predicted alpha/beta-hydrolase family hydrolase
MAPGQQGTSVPGAVAREVAQAATGGLAAGLDPASLALVVTGHSLGGALATLLVTELTARRVSVLRVG